MVLNFDRDPSKKYPDQLMVQTFEDGMLCLNLDDDWGHGSILINFIMKQRKQNGRRLVEHAVSNIFSVDAFVKLLREPIAEKWPGTS